MLIIFNELSNKLVEIVPFPKVNESEIKNKSKITHIQTCISNSYSTTMLHNNFNEHILFKSVSHTKYEIRSTQDSLLIRNARF